MSATLDCYCAPCSSTAAPVNTPGTNGQNAYSLVTADFTVPAVNATVTVSVDTTQWMVKGQGVVIGQPTGVVLANPGPASFSVSSIVSSTSVTLTYLGNPGDVAAAAVISQGAKVTPGNSGTTYQKGTATLVGGTVTVSNVRLTTSSIIQVTRNTPGTALNAICCRSADRNVGAGSFVIRAESAVGVLGTETSTVDYLIIG